MHLAQVDSSDPLWTQRRDLEGNTTTLRAIFDFPNLSSGAHIGEVSLGERSFEDDLWTIGRSTGGLSPSNSSLVVEPETKELVVELLHQCSSFGGIFLSEDFLNLALNDDIELVTIGVVNRPMVQKVLVYLLQWLSGVQQMDQSDVLLYIRGVLATGQELSFITGEKVLFEERNVL